MAGELCAYDGGACDVFFFSFLFNIPFYQMMPTTSYQDLP